VFWDHTFAWQTGRSSPFSLWDWRQYHARGLPNLHAVQRVLEALLVAGALVVAFVPRHKSPLQLAALTAALLAGFELVLTYWLYTYIPWFFPFAAITVLAPLAAVHAHADEPQLEQTQLVPAAG
jgi:CHASE2 domain-containing sensor protein